MRGSRSRATRTVLARNVLFIRSMQNPSSTQSNERTRSPAESVALQAWQEVVNGRLRVVDWYDRAGRRYILTKPNPKNSATPLAPRERRVLALRARGSALKVIAYELGVSMSTAARDLSRAMEQLGLESSSDLAAVLGHGNR